MVLDVWHFWEQSVIDSEIRNHLSYNTCGSYLAVVLNGMKNPLQNWVSKEITEVILRAHATTGKDSQPAMYWSHEEQKVRLEEAYRKYVKIGGVWSAAAVDESNN